MPSAEHLTEREKLVLSFAAFTGCQDWKYLYFMALERPRKLPPNNSSGVSRWKHLPRVVNYFKDQQAAAAARIVEHKKKAINDFIDSLPEYIRRAIRENRDISPEEFALPPRLQDLRTGMTREEYEDPGRISDYAKKGKRGNYDYDDNEHEQDERNTRKGCTADPSGLKVDFRNRDEALNYYNELANTTSDERIRMECVARISDLERFKAEVSQKNDITRAYMPLRCYECPLYMSARQKLEGESE